MKAQKFILIDDNEVFLGTLRTVLTNCFNADILDEASNAEEASKIETWHMADIILMDIMMPGKNGINLTKELLWHHHELKIIAITMHVDKVYLTSLIEAGFKGCIFKNDLMAQLSEAIDTVSSGSLFFPNDIIFDYNKKTLL